MKGADYRRVVSSFVPDADIKNRISKNIVRSLTAKKIWLAAIGLSAACIVAATIAVPLLLKPNIGTEIAVNTADSEPSVSPSRTAGLKIVYGCGDYSSLYTASTDGSMEDLLNNGENADDYYGVQKLDDLKKELEGRYSNKESIILADGNCVYSASNRTVSVLDSAGKVLGSTECGNDRSFLVTSEGEDEIGVYEYYDKLFITDGRLYALKSIVRVVRADGKDVSTDDGGIPYISQEYTLIEAYDVSEPQELRLIKEIAVSGTYCGAFVEGENFIAFTRYSQYEWPTDRARPETYVPMCYADNTMRVLGTEDIYHPKEYGESHIPVAGGEFFTGVSIGLNLETQSFIAVEERCEFAYFGESSVYMLYCRYTYEYDEKVRAKFNYTEIVRITDTDGKLSFAAQGRVRGTLLDCPIGIPECLFNEDGGFFTITTRINMAGYGRGKNGSLSHYDSNGKPYPNYFAFYTLDTGLNIVNMIDKIGYVSGDWLDPVAARRKDNLLYIVGEHDYEDVKKIFIIDMSNIEKPALLDTKERKDIDGIINWVCEIG